MTDDDLGILSGSDHDWLQRLNAHDARNDEDGVVRGARVVTAADRPALVETNIVRLLEAARRR